MTIPIIPLLITVVCSHAVVGQWSPIPGAARHRLIVLADMGNERDEEQQMVHLLMYANAFDLEGLIAVSGLFLNPSHKDPYKRVLHPELFDTLVSGYSRVYDNLQKHAAGWPAPDYLRSIISAGQREYGMEGTGEGKSSPGSRRIIQVVTKSDPRPVFIVVNAGSNTLAQAIRDYERSHTKAETDAFVEKMIVYENGSQDDAGAWIAGNYPHIHWIRSNYQTYAYAGPGTRISPDLGPYAWRPYPYTYEGQRDWAREHIQVNHGALGALYPDRVLRGQVEFLEGGGTAPWLGLITRGLSDLLHPGWGGWSGRFTATKHDTVWSRHRQIAERERTYGLFRVYADTADRWYDPHDDKEYNDIFAPLFRWRQHQFDDFLCRMDWCVQPFASANHNPVAVIGHNSDAHILFMDAQAGETLDIDGSASYDPDAHQTISFSWSLYPEAGTYGGVCELTHADQPVVRLAVPRDAGGKQLHLILDVADNSPIAVMHSYRRMIISVRR